jgi:hypothetical protein
MPRAASHVNGRPSASQLFILTIPLEAIRSNPPVLSPPDDPNRMEALQIAESRGDSISSVLPEVQTPSNNFAATPRPQVCHPVSSQSRRPRLSSHRSLLPKHGNLLLQPQHGESFDLDAANPTFRHALLMLPVSVLTLCLARPHSFFVDLSPYSRFYYLTLL